MSFQVRDFLDHTCHSLFPAEHNPTPPSSCLLAGIDGWEKRCQLEVFQGNETFQTQVPRSTPVTETIFGVRNLEVVHHDNRFRPSRKNQFKFFLQWRLVITTPVLN